MFFNAWPKGVLKQTRCDESRKSGDIMSRLSNKTYSAISSQQIMVKLDVDKYPIHGWQWFFKINH